MKPRAKNGRFCKNQPGAGLRAFHATGVKQNNLRVWSLALPLSAGNSAEFSEADNSKTIQPREINLTSLDSLGSCESIYIYFKP